MRSPRKMYGTGKRQDESKHLAAGGSSQEYYKEKFTSRHAPLTDGHPPSQLGKGISVGKETQRKVKGLDQSSSQVFHNKSFRVEMEQIAQVKTHDKPIKDGCSLTGRKPEKNAHFENMGKHQDGRGQSSKDETIIAAHALMNLSNAKSTLKTDGVGPGLSRLKSMAGVYPLPQSNNSWNMASGECPAADSRSQVLTSLELFEEQYMKLLQKQNLESRNRGGANRRIDIKAAMVLKKEGKWVNTTREVGEIPGVEIGDQFQYRAELAVVGLHTRLSAGIDYIKIGNKLFATCIVDSGRYNNERKSPDVLIYIGEGGNPEISKKKAEDQQLLRGNLALKTSMRAGLPVRVVRCYQSGKATNNLGVNNGSGLTYTYLGLYNISSCDEVRDEYRKLVYKFTMVRRQDPGGGSSSTATRRKGRDSEASDPACSQGEGGTIAKARGSHQSGSFVKRTSFPLASILLRRPSL